MAAIDEIIKWAQTIPKWQGDAVRRLMASGEAALTESDEKELLALAKGELKLASPPAVKAVPPAAGMFSSAPPSPQTISLLSIEKVGNVNAIQNGSALTFGKTGITVVYGDNGAGKSGFTRILKMTCNARDKDDRVLGNVFMPTPGIPTATIHIEHNGNPIAVKWIQGKPADPVVNQVSAFDARCARVITDERNEITYLPYGADVFEKLAKLVAKFKAQIEAEMVPVARVIDAAITPGTKAAALLEGLTAFTEEAEIASAAKWDSEDEDRLTEVQELLRTSSAQMASQELARFARLKARADSLRTSLAKRASDLLSITGADIKAAVQDKNAAQEAHKIALNELQVGEPLPGVASAPTWKLLYEAAKSYSEEVAYCGHEFPHVGDGAVCVLCQQPLGEKAAARFARFRKFMSGSTADALKKKIQRLEQLRKVLQELESVDLIALGAVGDELDAFDPGISEDLRKHEDAALARKNAALTALTESGGHTEVPLPELAPSVSARLSKSIAAISEREAIVAASAKPDEYKNLIKEAADLKARKALSARVDEVRKYVQTEKRNLELKLAAGSLKTLDITKRGTAVIRESLTPELLKAFQAELVKLGITNLPLSVHPLGVSGETQHEIKLDGVFLPSKTKISHVLSEGEARVIAVAGFLAELAVSGQRNPIVLDDPVSSLDHVYTGSIARRLAEEALVRQVIVFTHNIAFLMEIQDAVMEMGKKQTPVKLEIKTLRRQGNVAGVATGSVPWHGMKINQRAAHLEKLVAQLKSLYQTDMDSYNKEAAYIYGLLRESWEACIEEDVFSAVVSRYRNSVKTLQLAEVEISDTDVHAIDLNMSKCSTWMTGHDKSKALHSDRPQPTELLADIKVLRDFSSAIIKRRDATRSRRKAQTQA